MSLSSPHRVFRSCIALALALTVAPFGDAMAADDPAPAPAAAPSVHASPAPAPTDALAQARSLIAARQWSDALSELRRLRLSGNADWNNLMGYVLRKGATPDLEASERYYDAALRIDPNHLNTLEYSGELYLMKGDLARAEQRLAALARACASRCEQFNKLDAAVSTYRSSGGSSRPTSWRHTVEGR